MSGKPSLMGAVAEPDGDFGGYIVFESGGDGSVDDFGIPGDSVLVGLDGYVIEWALVDDHCVVGAVDLVGSVAEEVRKGVGLSGATVTRGTSRIVQSAEGLLTWSDSIRGFTCEHRGGAEVLEGDGAWAVGMVVENGQEESRRGRDFGVVLCFQVAGGGELVAFAVEVGESFVGVELVPSVWFLCGPGFRAGFDEGCYSFLCVRVKGRDGRFLALDDCYCAGHLCFA